MKLTPDYLKHAFSYHPPTEEQKPLYEIIRAAERTVMAFIALEQVPTYDQINAVLHAYADIINENAPDCADKTASIRCVRIARNALNEAVTLAHQLDNMAEDDMVSDDVIAMTVATAERCVSIALDNIIMARWQASSAIALEPFTP